MTTHLSWLLVAFCCSPSALAQPDRPISIATEFDLHSSILNEERSIVVALPEGYENSGATRYPVLYLTDGMQNLWHVVGTAEVLTRTGNMPPVIIVGIKSLDRNRDFTPTKIPKRNDSGGRVDFLTFMERELIPAIESRFRTHPYRILEGHSLGGLFAAFAFIHSAELFDAYVVMSPALWWNHEELTGQLEPFLAANKSLKKMLYFGIGMEDGNGMRQKLKRFVGAIERDAPRGVRWRHQEFKGEGHMSAPLLINYHAMKFIFADMQLPAEVWKAYSDARFVQHENEMMSRYGLGARQAQETYVPLGLQLLQEGNFQGAITVFKRNAEAYSGNHYPPNYAWLADAYEKNKDYSKALATYQKAYELSLETGYGEKEVYFSKIRELKILLEE